jgi:hypothetical protein
MILLNVFPFISRVILLYFQVFLKIISRFSTSTGDIEGFSPVENLGKTWGKHTFFPSLSLGFPLSFPQIFPVFP